MPSFNELLASQVSSGSITGSMLLYGVAVSDSINGEVEVSFDDPIYADIVDDESIADVDTSGGTMEVDENGEISLVVNLEEEINDETINTIDDDSDDTLADDDDEGDVADDETNEVSDNFGENTSETENDTDDVDNDPLTAPAIDEE